MTTVTWIDMPSDPPTESTVYAVVTANFGSDLGGVLLHSDGSSGVSHISSGEGWLKSDLTTGFADRAEQLQERYGDTLNAVFVADWSEAPEWLRKLNEEATK